MVILGDSAGAVSAAYHLLSYGGKAHPPNEAKAPFVGAVGVSPAIPVYHTVPDLEWKYDLLLQRTNCTTGKLACLRSLDFNTLQTANIGTPYPGRNNNPIVLYNPVVCISILPLYVL